MLYLRVWVGRRWFCRIIFFEFFKWRLLGLVTIIFVTAQSYQLWLFEFRPRLPYRRVIQMTTNFGTFITSSNSSSIKRIFGYRWRGFDRLRLMKIMMYINRLAIINKTATSFAFIQDRTDISTIAAKRAFTFRAGNVVLFWGLG